VEANITWNANPAGDNVTNYKLYWGYASGTYDGANSPIDVGVSIPYAFDETTPSEAVVFFSISAENSVGESSLSTEEFKLGESAPPPVEPPAESPGVVSEPTVSQVAPYVYGRETV